MSERQVALEDHVIDEVVAKHTNRTGDVLSVLEELQGRHPDKFLPKATLDAVARKMGVSRSQIFGVATFYSFFNLEPQGRRTLMICRGTACHTRGAKTLLDRLKTLLKLTSSDDGESYKTEDGQLTVRTVACFGQCALAPIIAVDDKIHGHVTDMQLKDIVAQALNGDA